MISSFPAPGSRDEVINDDTRYRALIELSPHIIWQSDTTGVVFANEHWYVYTGLTVEETLGRGWFAVIYPEDIQRFRRAWAEADCGAGVQEIELRFRRAKDGMYRWHLARSLPFNDATGTVGSWMGVAVDIHERKIAAAAMEEAEQRYRAVFEQAAVGLSQVAVDRRPLEVNERFCAMIGYTPEEIQATRFQDITHPSDRAQEYAFAADMLSGKTASCSFEKRLIHKDGHTVWVNATESLVRDSTGLPQYFIVVTEDITERKGAQVRLRRLSLKHKKMALRELELKKVLAEREDRFRRTQRAAQVATWDRDLKTDEVVWSEMMYRIYGLPSGTTQASYPAWRSALHPDDTDRVESELQTAISTQSSYAIEFRVVRNDREVRWLARKGEVIRDGNGSAVRLIGCDFDVTAQKNAEQGYRRLADRLQTIREEERGQLARAIHDELGQALTAVKLELSALKKRSDLNHGIKQISGLIDETIRSLRNLAMELRPAALDQLGLIPALEWQLKQFEQRTGVRYSLICDAAGSKLAPAIEIALFRIAQETLTNVARHAHATKVTLSFQRNGHWCILHIADDGVGCDAQVLHDFRSLGILGMRERARLIGGTLDIATAIDGGTAVVVCAPG